MALLGPASSSGVFAFVPAPLVPGLNVRLSPKQYSGIFPLRRCSVQGGDGAEEQEDNPNLFQVSPVPTHDEMLAWAAETDRRIAARELPPLGSGQPIAAAQSTGSLLTDQEQAQIATVSELLGKGRQEGSSLSQEEDSTLRAAMEGLSASVKWGRGFPAASSSVGGVSDAGSGDSVGSGVDERRKSDDLIRNPIYGSREVRDKVYLYAWSLMKEKQREAERREERL